MLPRAVLVGVAAAMVAVAIPLAEPLWLWITTVKVPLDEFFPRMRAVVDGHDVRGWYRVKRDRFQRRHGPGVWFYAENGRKAGESVWDDGQRLRVTYWRFDGSVMEQHSTRYRNRSWVSSESRSEPPWLWDVGEQRQPSAPWLKRKNKER